MVTSESGELAAAVNGLGEYITASNSFIDAVDDLREMRDSTTDPAIKEQIGKVLAETAPILDKMYLFTGSLLRDSKKTHLVVGSLLKDLEETTE